MTCSLLHYARPRPQRQRSAPPSPPDRHRRGDAGRGCGAREGSGRYVQRAPARAHPDLRARAGSGPRCPGPGRGRRRRHSLGEPRRPALVRRDNNDHPCTGRLHSVHNRKVRNKRLGDVHSVEVDTLSWLTGLTPPGSTGRLGKSHPLGSTPTTSISGIRPAWPKSTEQSSRQTQDD